MYPFVVLISAYIQSIEYREYTVDCTYESMPPVLLCTLYTLPDATITFGHPFLVFCLSFFGQLRLNAVGLDPYWSIILFFKLSRSVFFYFLFFASILESDLFTHAPFHSGIRMDFLYGVVDTTVSHYKFGHCKIVVTTNSHYKILVNSSIKSNLHFAAAWKSHFCNATLDATSCLWQFFESSVHLF